MLHIPLFFPKHWRLNEGNWVRLFPIWRSEAVTSRSSVNSENELHLAWFALQRKLLLNGSNLMLTFEDVIFHRKNKVAMFRVLWNKSTPETCKQIRIKGECRYVRSDDQLWAFPSKHNHHKKTSDTLLGTNELEQCWKTSTRQETLQLKKSPTESRM